MSYESGLVLARRQQREYPPELRQEIALLAIEIGNNREVARVYSLKLGYTVNESTVRGIKKRYLEGIQRGKIAAPAGLLLNCFSPRSSTLQNPHSTEEGTFSHESSFGAETSIDGLQGEEECQGDGEGLVEGQEFTGDDIEELYYSREDEDVDQIEPESVMKLQLEILEGRMKEEVDDHGDLSSNGDLDEPNPLSIVDTEPEEAVKPAIRINKGILCV
ncbi:uncharacterized protein LOC111711969 isoform X2 [Eurytemora carolleeae]|uniref:uncharacterized protein LOC111711969 isoform X2 n=1 Tax=Eurytemora carolleeae TaxID=1294199 RepID=UPI000C78A57C|nr:uncharacterized protein LOC111711969 isoform X2 [Eurytemora carolleeae]|eukprot:XP_023342233.1 uncharacterized protein LOC111711969 isoform X2 [Eurytemora affinis]